MLDNEIINLYFARNEDAITETDMKYGKYLNRIAFNVLGSPEDSEECVNDTYHSAWNIIPPQIPLSLMAFLGKITRNLSISRYRANHALKRYNGMEIMLSELEECVPDSFSVEGEIEAKEVSGAISAWLRTLGEDDRRMFVRRYWYGIGASELAGEEHITVNRVNVRLCRLRKGLKAYLVKEDICHET